MLGGVAVPLRRDVANFLKPQTLKEAILQTRPRAVINCAAWTAVDDAENSPEDCRKVNADAVFHLAQACNQIDATLVQVSTDYVYGGDTDRVNPYAETDKPCPANYYGVTKLAGEKAAATAQRHLITRTCGLYSPREDGPVRGRNFPDTMLVLSKSSDDIRVVNDQQCTPSFVPHVAHGILELLGKEVCGIYHVVNNGSTNWHGFAYELFSQAGLNLMPKGISTNDYPTVAPRPHYSVLDAQKFCSSVGHPLPHWKNGISEYLKMMQVGLTQKERYV
tara:strand:+ start:4046 stop:4876 length:831 start_codon:yes stop_codon:yes gene_type:complete